MKLLISTLSLIFLSFSLSESKLFNPRVLINLLKPKILDIIDSSVNGTECGSDLKKFINGLYKHQLWAITMFDANSKLQNGLLEGNAHSYGNYDQCLSMKKDLQGNLWGQYCTMYLILNEKATKFLYTVAKVGGRKINKKFIQQFAVTQHGLCIPKSCSTTNVTVLMNQVQKRFYLPFQAKFREESCYYKDKQISENTIDKYVFVFIFLFVFLEIASTCYDFHLRKSGNKPDIFVSFSLYSNAKRLFTTNNQKDTLTCLYGIRVLSTIWIILGHIALIKAYVSTNRVYVMSEWPRRLGTTFFIAAPYTVDTFFAMSGLLLVYTYLKKNKEKSHWMWFYVQRLFRLVPALVVVVVFNISIAKYLVEGPLTSHTLDFLKNNCENNWWATLFFVSNFVSLYKQCIMSTWYLSVDTQLYLAAPLLLSGFTKNPKKTFLAILTLCILSFAHTWTTVIKHNLGFIPIWEIPAEMASITYISTLNRMPTWLIGASFGYILHHHKINISKIANLGLWTLSLSTMIFFVLYQTVFFHKDHSVYRSVFFNTFSRPLWALSVCFIIFSCSTGRGGIINTFLSHPVFVVLGKLTYSIYLVHLTVLFIIQNNTKQAIYFSTFNILFEFWGCFVMIVVLATILNIGFEAPFISVMYYLKKRQLKKIQ